MPSAPQITNCASEVLARCQKLATFSEDPGSIRRTFLSPPMRDCHREIAAWLHPLGVEVTIDAVGNLRAFYPASQAGAPTLLIGSHLDTVPNAGAYDGILGVVLAVALLQNLEGKRLPFGIELVGFSEEEGVRFGVPFIGSRALIGKVDQELLECRDRQGISVLRAIEDFGLDPEQISQAGLKDDTLGYIEFHIEQGPVLNSLGKPLAAVEAIAGQSRLEFTFTGRSNHAGTTPMNLRRDAIAAAAEWVSSVERLAHSVPGLVATVGRLDAKPGAINVVAGEALGTLDVRHGSGEIRHHAVHSMVRAAEEIAARRGLKVQHRTLMEQQAVAMDPFLSNQIEAAIRDCGCEPHRMVSGAGHDAMILAQEIPAAMVFLRTPGGISHDPAESVALDDVAKAIECGRHLLNRLAAATEFHTRKDLA